MKNIIIASIILGVMMALVNASAEPPKNLLNKKQEAGYLVLPEPIVVPICNEVQSANHPNADYPVCWVTYHFKEPIVLWPSKHCPELGLS
jgi:hypothetical protein